MYDIFFIKSWYIYLKNVFYVVYRNIYRYLRKGKIFFIFYLWLVIYGIEQVNEKYLYEFWKRGYVINEMGYDIDIIFFVKMKMSRDYFIN